MNVVALFGTRFVHRVPCMVGVWRKLCDYSSDGDAMMDNGFQLIEEPLKRTWGDSGPDSGSELETHIESRWSQRQRGRFEAERVIEVLRQDGPGVDTKAALTELHIFADCDEFMAMWRVVEEMTESGFPTTARTFNILICTCAEAGLARRVVERFIQSKTFNYRPFKHSYNAIIYSLLGVRHYRLIDWVHQKMLGQGLFPDVLTYNVIMCAKYRLGELGQVWKVVDEMVRNGYSPDFHTYNIILHVLGKGNKPLAAHKLLNHMKEEGIGPCVLHYTTLIDGLSRAGNLQACEGFLDEMKKNGCLPDVVCYTVIITAYVMAGEFEKAQAMFDDMTTNGQLPNAFTYSSMIRGYCMAGKYKVAISMLNEMESKGCSPTFLVYRTLVSNLRSAGKFREARSIIEQMVEKGRYAHLVQKIRGNWQS
ncbi:unnamed protein product [Linum tenue]|uniref:Pentatricopeptide repeat-containing protein n=1 Tax=Linum tenue TaxID=586396 RepID=A0AAV0J3C0_9ROSI|nr:unnamed protein product [Linum tenue]